MQKFIRALVIVTLGGILLIGGCIVGFAFTPLALTRISQARQGSPDNDYYDPMRTPDATMISARQHLEATIQAVTRGMSLVDDPLVVGEVEIDKPDYSIKNTDEGLVITTRLHGKFVYIYNTNVLPPDVDASVTVQGLPPAPCQGWYTSLHVRRSYNGDDQNGFYELQLHNDGSWRFWHSFPLTPYEGNLLAAGGLGQDFNMLDANTLRIVAQGDHFALYVNGKQVGEADDHEDVSPRTSAGVSVLTCEDEAKARFTNLLITTP